MLAESSYIRWTSQWLKINHAPLEGVGQVVRIARFGQPFPPIRLHIMMGGYTIWKFAMAIVLAAFSRSSSHEYNIRVNKRGHEMTPRGVVGSEGL